MSWGIAATLPGLSRTVSGLLSMCRSGSQMCRPSLILVLYPRRVQLLESVKVFELGINRNDIQAVVVRSWH